MAIKFYSNRERYACLSNFAPYPFELDGRVWPTVEHYFQAQKFPGSPYQEEIRSAATPTRPSSSAAPAHTRSAPTGSV